MPIARRVPIARRARAFSVANLNDPPELLRAGTMRAPLNHRTRVASICLAAGTRQKTLAAGARAASIWPMADMRRRVLTAAENIPAGGTRTVGEVTPAATVVASITAELEDVRSWLDKKSSLRSAIPLSITRRNSAMRE